MDIEHPSEPDPLRREHPEQFQPQPLQSHKSAEIINATQDYRASRKLAEAAGVDPEMLKMVKEI